MYVSKEKITNFEVKIFGTKRALKQQHHMLTSATATRVIDFLYYIPKKCKPLKFCTKSNFLVLNKTYRKNAPHLQTPNQFN